MKTYISKQGIGSVLFDIFNFILQISLILLCLYPFYYLLIYSLSDPSEVSRGIYLLPRGFTLENYTQVLKLPGIFRAVLISTSRTIVGTIFSVVGCMLYAYILTKKELPFRKIIYRMTIITMYVGGGLIPTYIVLKSYGFINSFWVYVIPGAISAFNVVLCKTYIEQLPEVLEESAMIDGAGYFYIFWKILFPLLKPACTTLLILNGIGLYNDFYIPNLYLNKEVQTFTVALYKFFGSMSTPFEIVAAAILIGIVPIGIVFLCLQKYIYYSLAGAVKS